MLKLPHHNRYDYVPLPQRRDYDWPGGKRLAFCLTNNMSWNAFGKGRGHDNAKHGEPQTQRNYSWRDYGNRIGVWRLFDLADEARLIREVTATFTKNEGKPPKGWLSGGSYENPWTVDLLEEAGYLYICDWPADDQPLWMRTRSGPILSVPYPVELNDSPQIIHRQHSAREFCDMLVDQFEEMIEQSAKHPLVCNVSIHPHTFGYPFRLRPLRTALRHCFSNRFVDRVWKCRPGDIADYCLTLAPGTIP